MTLPKFDYAAARAAGHSDEEIGAYLRKQKASGVDVWLDRKEVDSLRAAQSAPPVTAAPSPGSPFRPIDAVGASMGGPGQGLLKLAGQHPGTLPNVGGLLGGLGGGAMGVAAGPGAPAAIPALGSAGSMFGGMAGQGLEDVLFGRPASLERAGLEGARQLGYHTLGLGAGAALGAAGRAIAPKAAAAVPDAVAGLRGVAPQGLGFFQRIAQGAGKVGEFVLPKGAGPAAKVAGKVAVRIVANPMIRNKSAAFLSSTAAKTLARQSPRAFAAMYQQMVLTEEPDATQQR